MQSGSSTDIRRTEISYGDGGEIAAIVVRDNGVVSGTLEATYADGHLMHIDVADADGDNADMSFAYDDDGRLIRTEVVAPEVYDIVDEYDYTDGLLREIATRSSWYSEPPESTYTRYEHDDDGRLVEIRYIDGSETDAVLEYRYDNDDRLERVTTYYDNDIVAMYTFAYDSDNRLDSVDGLDNERWDVSYTDDGYIEEIRHINPSSNQTTTVTYTYTSEDVRGIRFVPDLPSASLLDLRGRAFSNADLMNLAPASLNASVPSPPPDPVCGDGICDSPEETATSCPTDCSTSGSCFGNCGGSAGTCYCDSVCTESGDCCPDYQTACF